MLLDVGPKLPDERIAEELLYHTSVVIDEYASEESDTFGA
jgi:hypothetical protein